MTELMYGTMTDTQLRGLLQAAMQNAAQGLSDMAGRPITINTPHVEKISINQIVTHAGSPETEIVGIYLLATGDFSGQVILMLPLAEALYLVDLLMGTPPGTTTELGEMEISALAEAGNLTTAYFLNEIAARTTVSSRPSPPAVLVDMLGAVMDIVTTPVASYTDVLMIAETIFQDSGRAIVAYFWVLPYYPAELNALTNN